jgi:hypothetical protein
MTSPLVFNLWAWRIPFEILKTNAPLSHDVSNAETSGSARRVLGKTSLVYNITCSGREQAYLSISRYLARVRGAKTGDSNKISPWRASFRKTYFSETPDTPLNKVLNRS